MKRMDYVDFKASLYLGSRALKTMLSEDEILSLQESFLSSGIHKITVANLPEGRTMLAAFLESLRYFTRPAVLTTQLFSHPSVQIAHLYRELLAHEGIFESRGMLEDFMLNHFYYDFLAIEATPDLRAQAWFVRFEQLLHDYKFTETVPVVMFVYE